jgi:hypothetical protein
LGSFYDSTEESEQEQGERESREHGSGWPGGGEPDGDEEAEPGEERAVNESGLLLGQVPPQIAAGPETPERAENDDDAGEDREVGEPVEVAFGHQSSVCVARLPA